MRNIQRDTDAIFTTVKVAFFMQLLFWVAACIFCIWGIIQVSNYIADECNGSVSYCVGKVFSESKEDFNRGLEGKK